MNHRPIEIIQPACNGFKLHKPKSHRRNTVQALTTEGRPAKNDVDNLCQ